MTLVQARRGRAKTGLNQLILTYKGSDDEATVSNEVVGTASFAVSNSVVVVAAWFNAEVTSESVTSISVGGQSLTKRAEQLNGSNGVSIWSYNGSVSGTVFAGTSDLLDNVWVFVYELAGATPAIADTDTGTNSLSALASPGEFGHRICGAFKGGAAITWTGATEDDEVPLETLYASVAHDSGDDSGTISVSGAAAMAGVSFSVA